MIESLESSHGCLGHGENTHGKGDREGDWGLAARPDVVLNSIN